VDRSFFFSTFFPLFLLQIPFFYWFDFEMYILFSNNDIQFASICNKHQRRAAQLRWYLSRTHLPILMEGMGFWYVKGITSARS